jgi:hypothetical protein
MPQLKQPLDEARIPFSKMSFTPDVPSTQLGPNEYNSGYNIETDVRGIRSVAGDEAILATVPGTPTFISGGFRADTYFWFIVATDEGHWWASKGGAWQDITPPGGPFAGYNQATNITDAWNGTVPFFNDTINPPMFWLDGDSQMTMYSNLFPSGLSTIVYISPTVQQIQGLTYTATTPYQPGDKIIISGTNTYYDGTFTVVSSTSTTINYTASPAGAFSSGSSPTVGPLYTWNYNSNWKSVSASFMRMYNTPNVGSILVAGNLTAVNLDDSVSTYPVTVQWSQAFGLNQAPITWTPTITNVANQLEVPLRGPAVDAFPCNGNFYLSSYWDTVVFNPINYSTTSAPILGVKLINQGRGLLSSNTWANTDTQVYGIDARDVWVFDGNNFTGIGNQRVKNWLFDQLDPAHYDRVFMEVNTQKNQIEIYYPTTTATNGVPNKMISYRYDLDCWNPPRDVASATMGTESPVWELVGSTWTPNLSSRTIVYARGATNQSIVQKDQGYSFLGSPIVSNFRRDNIKMLPNYSGKLLVHRILPEVVNLTSKGLPIDPATQSDLIGSVGIKIEGANSVGQAPVSTTAITMATNTDQPWTQINQNAHRVNTIEIGNSSTANIWMCSATTWQTTQTEDDR